MAAFDAEAARKAGYSQAEVDALQGRITAAKQAGYSDDEISKYLSSGQADNSEQATIPWGDVASGFVSNFPSSAYKNVIEPWVEHPVETAKGLGRLGLGGLQAMADPASMVTGQNVASEDVKAIGADYAQAYGGVENIKRTLRDDPFRAVSDVSMVTGAGEAAAAARAPGIASKLGSVSRITNPFDYSTSARALRTVGSEVFGRHTGVGAEPIKTAARAGYEGGAPFFPNKGAQAFREEIKGERPKQMVVEDATDALGQMQEEKNIGYEQGRARFDLGKDMSSSWANINKAQQDAAGIKRFEGRDIDPATKQIRDKVNDLILEYQTNPNPKYHTLEGFDALKQEIGSEVFGNTERGSPARFVGQRMYNAVRDAISKADPEYGRVMRGYDLAREEIVEIQKALQLGDGKSADAALRRLQSVMRDNVHTNYGNRRMLAEYLAKVGAPELMERLAGQALSSGMPRGVHLFAIELAAALAAFAEHGAVGAVAGFGAGLAASSPRLVGEAAYWGGRAASPLRYLPEGTAAGLQYGSAAARSLGQPAPAP